ncbi:MAG: phosphate ABC transporter permease subunit PstC, partial [Corynebacterium sp.]|nr:phosphate ABC transporter permease subunit PstC [Corynebacterium sp.]
MSSSTPIEGKQEAVDSSLLQSSAPQVDSSGDESSEEQAIQTGVVRPGDRIFKILAVGSSALVTAAIIAIAVFLLLRAVPAMSRNEANFFTYTERWNLADTSAMY